MTWFEDFFQGVWFDIQRARYPGDSAKDIAANMCSLLDIEAGTAVLDVPVGTGIIALELVARGASVTGVDLSREALDVARAQAHERGLALALHCRDMRDLPFESAFDVAINYWGSFGYFDDEGDDAFARAVYEALKPGGRFLIEVPSAETIYPGFKASDESTIGDIRVREERTLDLVTGRVRDEWTFTKEGRPPETRVTDIRVYSCAELCALLRRVGFTSFAPYATLTGRPFEIGARLNLVATR